MNPHDFSSELAELDAQTLLRTRRVVSSPCGAEIMIDGKRLINFCSNDYLGLANDAALIAAAQDGAQLYGVGAGASHLVCGHSEPHEALEHRLAEFVGAERALFFSAGYMANLGVVTALLGRDDAIFSDALNHASLIDAARLSRATIHRYDHLDIVALDTLLAESKARRKLVVSDAVFSMDGDIAPLDQLMALCERHDALLLADDAHGFGVLGPQGRGTPAHFLAHCDTYFDTPSPRLIHMGTLGKAAGVSGAFVSGSAGLIEWLMQKARTYIYTTASPPLLAYALLTSIDLIESGDARRAQLAARIAQFRSQLKLRRWRLAASSTPIQPLIIGDNQEALAVAKALMERGLWVVAIRPPTVPQGTTRLRITLSAAHSEAQVDHLTNSLMELEAR